MGGKREVFTPHTLAYCKKEDRYVCFTSVNVQELSADGSGKVREYSKMEIGILHPSDCQIQQRIETNSEMQNPRYHTMTRRVRVGEIQGKSIIFFSDIDAIKTYKIDATPLRSYSMFTSTQ